MGMQINDKEFKCDDNDSVIDWDNFLDYSVPAGALRYRANSIVAPNCPLTDADLAGVRAVRSQMLDGGYQPLAVHSPWSLACDEIRAGKAPLGKDWQKGQPRWRLFGNHPEWSRASANTGLLLGGSDLALQALDFDIDEVTVMAAVLATVKHIVPRQSLIRLRANSPRVAMVLRCEPVALKEKLQGEHGAVERLATGQQVVVHGTHPTGARLEWHRQRSPWTVQAAALPLMDEAAVAAMFSGLAASGALGSKLDRTSAKSHPGGAGPRGDIAVAFKACVTRCGGIVPAVGEFLRETGERGTYRHDTLVSVAGHLIRVGWPLAQAARLLTENADKWFGEGSWAKEVADALSHATRRQGCALARRSSISAP
jgi:hypothetical protein